MEGRSSERHDSVADVTAVLVVHDENDNAGENIQNSVRSDRSEGPRKNANNERNSEGVSGACFLS